MKTFWLIDDDGEEFEAYNRCDDDILPDALVLDGQPYLRQDLPGKTVYVAPLTCERAYRVDGVIHPDATDTPAARATRGQP